MWHTCLLLRVGYSQSECGEKEDVDEVEEEVGEVEPGSKLAPLVVQ